jgi:hypothetical protein
MSVCIFVLSIVTRALIFRDAGTQIILHGSPWTVASRHARLHARFRIGDIPASLGTRASTLLPDLTNLTFSITFWDDSLVLPVDDDSLDSALTSICRHGVAQAIHSVVGGAHVEPAIADVGICDNHVMALLERICQQSATFLVCLERSLALGLAGVGLRGHVLAFRIHFPGVAEHDGICFDNTFRSLEVVFLIPVESPA